MTGCGRFGPDAGVSTEVGWDSAYGASYRNRVVLLCGLVEGILCGG